MKTLRKGLLFFLLLMAISSGFAGTPAMDVIVLSSTGKIVHRGKVSPNDSFTTGAVEPGFYVVQFIAKDSAGVKGNVFGLAVSAGKNKMNADNVEGQKFIGAGVAMRVEVGSRAGITGRMTSGRTAVRKSTEHARDIQSRMGGADGY